MGKCFQYFGRLYIEYLDYFCVAEFRKLLNGRLSFQALCNTMHYGKVDKFKVVISPPIFAQKAQNFSYSCLNLKNYEKLNIEEKSWGTQKRLLLVFARDKLVVKIV